MPRATDPSADILALMTRLGWRSGDDQADLACLISQQGKPTRKVTADTALALVASEQAGLSKPRNAAVISFPNPCADGLARAARNGDAISDEAEQRMKADKKRARAERAARKPKPQ